MNKYYSEAKHSRMQIQNALRVIDELVEVSLYCQLCSIANM